MSLKSIAPFAPIAILGVVTGITKADNSLNIFDSKNWKDHFWKTGTIALAEAGSVALGGWGVLRLLTNRMPRSAEITLFKKAPDLNLEANPNLGRTVLEVTSHTEREGIIIQGWENVQHALRFYESGALSSSQATTIDIAQNHGFLGLFAKAQHDSQHESSFLQRLFANAEEGIKASGSWSRYYDYDGVGSFHKTTVHIQRIDPKNEIYSLGLHAARIGLEPEIQLAKAIGKERALNRVDISSKLEAAGPNVFAFDFEHFLRRLDSVFPGLKNLTGSEVAQSIVGNETRMSSSSKYPLIFHNGIVVSIYPETVQQRFVYNDKYTKGFDTWQAQGSHLVGYLKEVYDKPGVFHPPSIGISLEFMNRDHAYDVAQHQKMLTLAAQIEDAINIDPLRKLVL